MIKSTDVTEKTIATTVASNITTIAALTARNTAFATFIGIVTPATTINTTIARTIVSATTTIVPTTVTAKSTTIIATISNTAAIIPITAATIPIIAAAISTTTITAVKTTTAAISATEYTATIMSTPHIITSDQKVAIIDILTTAAATFVTRNTATAVFTTAVAKITTVAAAFVSECCINAIPIFPLQECCHDTVPMPYCCDISSLETIKPTTVISTLSCCPNAISISDCCTSTTAAAKSTAATAKSTAAAAKSTAAVAKSTIAAAKSTIAATVPTATSKPLCCVDALPIPGCCKPTRAATIPTTAVAKPTTAAIGPIVTSTPPDCCMPTTIAARSTVATKSATAISKPDCCGIAIPTLDCCDISSINISPTAATRHVIRSVIPIGSDPQFRYQHLSKNLNERFIPDDNQIRAKRQIELCSACDNVLPISGTVLINGERDGQLAIIYGADLAGCRTANLICDSGFLVNQTAIIYANGAKNIPLAMSVIGSVQITLTCDENIRWKAPNSRINIWNVTCILRDHPVPTTPIPTTIPPIPCSTCANLIAARVQNPALNEGDGKLIIEYTANEMGCRLAKIVCTTSDINTEVVIYFNGMKNMPVASSIDGTVSIPLICRDNRRFRVDGSRVNVESVTCLSRDLPIVPTIIPTLPTIKPPPVPVPTTKPPITPAPIPPTITPPLCTVCENIKVIKKKILQLNEMNDAVKIEYSKGIDGCRLANIVCGNVKPGAVARIYFNDETYLPFIADTTGEAQLDVFCNDNARWRTFESRINIASISCTVLVTPPTPIPTKPIPPSPLPPVTTRPTIQPTIPTTIPGCITKWTTWGHWSICTDTCGAYGTRQRFRSCERNREECFCLGSISETEFCNLQPCLYPRTACRPNYMVSSVNQKFVCVPIR